MQKLVLVVFTVFTFVEFNPFTPSLSDAYIREYKDIAISEMYRSGIPASIKLAQGLLESDWGRSDLANIANNHFGIKCGANWSGRQFYKEDDDYHNGQLISSCFRSYDNAQESYIAHTDFLSEPRKSKRYDFLFEYERTDYKNWAKGLQKAGYATDPKYPQKLIRIIEKYELYKYDLAIPREVELANTDLSTEDDNRNIPKNTKEENVENAIVETKTDVLEPIKTQLEYVNNIPVVKAREGETPLSLAKRTGVSYASLAAFNEMLPGKNETFKKEEILYLKEKNRKFGNRSSQHIVKAGETMYSIAQLYGIKLQNLYAKNRMPKKSQPLIGEKLNLGIMIKVGKRPKFKTERQLKQRKDEFLFDDMISLN